MLFTSKKIAGKLLDVKLVILDIWKILSLLVEKKRATQNKNNMNLKGKYNTRRVVKKCKNKWNHFLPVFIVLLVPKSLWDI